MLNKNTPYFISQIIEEAGLPVFVSKPNFSNDFSVKLTEVKDNNVNGIGYKGTQPIGKVYTFSLESRAYYCDWSDIEEKASIPEVYDPNAPYTLPPRDEARFHYYYDLTLPKYIPGKTILQVKREGQWVNAIFTGYELRNEKPVVYTFYKGREKFCRPNGSLIGEEIPFERAGYNERVAIEYLSNRSSSKTDIYDYLAYDRYVKYLIHFTPVDNLKSILENGIAPRVYFEDGVDFVTTDRIRMDNHPECSCFSISFPNYQMLSKKRNETGFRFAVLCIDIKALLSSNVDKIYMLPVNAAHNEVRLHIEDYDQLQDARNMFAKELTYKGTLHRRNELGIPREYTTNPQAELMIDGIVPANYIREIHFNTETALVNAQGLKELLPDGAKMLFSNDLFKRRIDCEHW